MPRKGSGGQAAVIDGLSLTAVQTWLRGISKSKQGQTSFFSKIENQHQYEFCL